MKESEELKDIGTLQVHPGERAYIELVDPEGRATGIAFSLHAITNPEFSKNSIEYALFFHSPSRCDSGDCSEPIIQRVVTPSNEAEERKRNEAVRREIADQERAERAMEMAKALGLEKFITITESGEFRTIKLSDLPPSG